MEGSLTLTSFNMGPPLYTYKVYDLSPSNEQDPNLYAREGIDIHLSGCTEITKCMLCAYLSAEFFLELEALDVVRDAARMAETADFREPGQFLRPFQNAETRFFVVAFIAEKCARCDLFAQ